MGIRHAMREYFIAVICSTEMIHQIDGWSSGKVGEGYGEGFQMNGITSRVASVTLLPS
jgi:hypothetical protein